MDELVYRLSFNTPAFLGDAQQQAQWRTPPIKALIRQWWRVVKAQQFARPGTTTAVRALRSAEGDLFGAAADGDSSRSLLRLRLAHWDHGNLTAAKWPRAEIKDLRVGQGVVPADVYIGFGPVLPASRKENRPTPTLGRNVIAPDVVNELRLRFDRRMSPQQRGEVERALELCQWFGTIGSRSRNGWGSLALARVAGVPAAAAPLPTVDQVRMYTRPLTDCFDTDWAHAIGADRDGPLVWTGSPVKNWREAVFALAQTRHAVRNAAKQKGRNQDISANQLIAYPVTQSGNNAWGTRERFASPLRLKVHRTPAGLVPLAAHLPCALPRGLVEKLGASDQRWVSENQVAVWQAVHRELDQRMARIGTAQ